MKYNHTPLRYPGGKGRLANFFKLVLSKNQLGNTVYVEPYAGGAGAAFTLLFHEYASCIHINDINTAIYAFWHSVLNETAALVKKIKRTPVTIGLWEKQQKIQKAPEKHSLLELGFSTFFLNRTNRSGILTGGVIGGKDQTGKWKIDARFNKSNLIGRIEKIALYKNRISIYNMDADKFIKKVIPSLPQNTLIYFDPPYYVKGQHLYQNHYQHEDHLKIASLISKKVKRDWIVSYDNVIDIRRMYKGHKKLKYDLSYSASNRYSGSEIMIFSDRLTIPKVQNPVKVNL